LAVACRSWLVCFLHCGSNLRPALLAHWWSLLSCLMLVGCGCARWPSLLSQVAVTALLRIGCIPLSTLPPSSSVLSSPPNQDLYYIYASVRGEKSAHLLGLKIKQLVCLWVKGGARLRSVFPSLSAHASLVHWLQP
jgi:hypothetical protein